VSWTTFSAGIVSIVLGFGCASAPVETPLDDSADGPDTLDENVPLSEAAQVEADRAVLAQLQQTGADLTKPTHIIHYLYFASQDAAVAARAHVPAPLVATVDDAEGEWELAVAHDDVPSLANIAKVRQQLMAIAAAHRGAYDGWEAAVTP